MYVRLPEGLQLPAQCSSDNASCMEPAALFQVSVFGDTSLFQGVLANDLVAPADGSNAAFTSAVVNISIASYQATPFSCAAGSTSCRAQLLLPLGSASAAPPSASLACVQLLPSTSGVSLTSAQALYPATVSAVAGSSYANCSVPHLGLFALAAYTPAHRPANTTNADGQAGGDAGSQGGSTGADASQGNAPPPDSSQASNSGTSTTAPGTLPTSGSGSGSGGSSDNSGTGDSNAEVQPGLLNPGSASITADETNSLAPSNSTSGKQGSGDTSFVEELTAAASGLRPGQVLGVVIGVVVAAALLACMTYMAIKNRAARNSKVAAPPPFINGSSYGAGMAANTATTSSSGGASASAASASAAASYMVPGQEQQLAGPALPQRTSALPRAGASTAPASHPLSPRGLRYENLRAAARLDAASDVQI